jgi:4a-hydroxytetrahydrobiopterin dehydratase
MLYDRALTGPGGTGMAGKIDAAARAAALKDLKGWQDVDGRDAIAKTYQFKDFTAAFAWMKAVAQVAERMDHHPEWRNVYRTVEVVLTSHDAGGVTERDVTMAREMDRLAGAGA